MPKIGSASAWRLWGLSITVIVIGTWAVGFVFFTESLPSAAETPQATDGIVVLTGEGERLTAAVRLLRGSVGRRLLVSGVGQGIGEASLRKVLGLSAAQGPGEEDIFSCCIDMGHQARDTEGNALEAVAWAERHGYKSLCIVTASYHMPRALLEIRRLAPHLELVPFPVFPDHLVVSKWWAFPGTALALAAEYNKYLIAQIRAVLIGSSQSEGAT